MTRRIDLSTFFLPLLGIGVVLTCWTMLSRHVAPDLPSPWRTWEESQAYVLRPFFKDGEMNQGIGRFALLSLARVSKGFALAIAVGTPLGFLLGLSPYFRRTCSRSRSARCGRQSSTRRWASAASAPST
jgi:nitrate/nitrite transport system permease protein